MANTIAMSGLHLTPVSTSIAGSRSSPLTPILQQCQPGSASPGRDLMPSLRVVCKKNHHRSPCTHRSCGLGAQDSLLGDLEEELQGHFFNMCTSAFLDVSEPGSPRGSRGGARSMFADLRRSRRRSGDGMGHSPQEFEGETFPDLSEEGHGPAEDELVSSSGLTNRSSPTPAKAGDDVTAGSATRQMQSSTPVETQSVPQKGEVSWYDSLKGQMFWLFRTLGTVVD